MIWPKCNYLVNLREQGQLDNCIAPTHNNSHGVPFADLDEPSLDLISAWGCIKFGDRQTVFMSAMEHHSVLKGGRSSVRRTLTHKCFILNRKQSSLSLGESFISHKESFLFWIRIKLCPGVRRDFPERIFSFFIR